MKSLEGFFEKFRGRAVLEIQTRTVIAEICKKYLKIDLEMKDIAITRGVITLNVPSAVKNEIYIKKSLILKEISQKITSTKFIDLR